MGINLVYERANKEAYELLVAGAEMATGSDLSELITNSIFPTILNKVGDTITRSDLVDRNYEKFKLPLSEFGAITEYLVSSMIRADDSTATATGTCRRGHFSETSGTSRSTSASRSRFRRDGIASARPTTATPTQHR